MKWRGILRTLALIILPLMMVDAMKNSVLQNGIFVAEWFLMNTLKLPSLPVLNWI